MRYPNDIRSENAKGNRELEDDSKEAAARLRRGLTDVEGADDTNEAETEADNQP